MAHFKVEMVVDPGSRLFFAELYYPSHATTPITRTRPIYRARDQAEEGVLKMMQQALPNIQIDAGHER